MLRASLIFGNSTMVHFVLFFGLNFLRNCYSLGQCFIIIEQELRGEPLLTVWNSSCIKFITQLALLIYSLDIKLVVWIFFIVVVKVFFVICVCIGLIIVTRLILLVICLAIIIFLGV